MMGPIGVMLVFSSCIWAVLGWWSPNSFFVLLTPKCPFDTQKTLRSKGKMSNFDVKHTIKLGKNARRTNGSIFTRVDCKPLPPMENAL